MSRREATYLLNQILQAQHNAEVMVYKLKGFLDGKLESPGLDMVTPLQFGAEMMNNVASKLEADVSK